MRPVGHALIAIAAVSTLRILFLQPVPSAGVFLGAFVAAIMDLDNTEEPPFNTPRVHSVMMASIWNMIGVLMTISFRSFFDPVDVIIGISLGIWSHLLFDALFKETVYTWPTLKKAQGRTELVRLHDGGLAVSSSWEMFHAYSNGEHAWPCWGRFHLVKTET